MQVSPDYGNRMKPPTNLTKEMHIVWMGWSKIGDREVIRESAAKGTHIELAYTFLSQRLDQPISDIKCKFKAEVLDWVAELLRNKQIFRASHILRHLGLEPAVEFRQILMQTTDVVMRLFIADHLDKQQLLDEDIKLHLSLFNLMANDGDVLEAMPSSLRALTDCEETWKRTQAAKLFLRYYDFSITPLLDAETLWMCAVEHQQRPFLQMWLDVQFSEENESQENGFKELLGSLHITKSMLHDEKTSSDMQTFLFDVTTKYGIFPLEELNDLEKILQRIVKHQLLANIPQLLSGSFTNLPYTEFQTLLRNYCIEKHYYTILDSYSTSNEELEANCDIELKLLQSCNKLAANCNNYEVIASNLELIQQFLKLPANPILDLFRLSLTSSNLHPHLLNLENMLETLPQLGAIARKMITKPFGMNLSRYDLLRKHFRIDVDDIFSWSLSNAPFPHFKEETLAMTHGRRKKVDYMFYVLQGRPHKAAKHLKDQSYDEAIVKANIRQLAIQNIQLPEVAMSCINFLEIVHIDTEMLRLELKSLQILLENHNIHEHEDICEMFFCEEWARILHETENSYLIIMQTTKQSFTDNLELLEDLVKMARAHHLDLPLLYLEHLAHNSKWMEFLILIQHFHYPIVQLSKTFIHFENDALRDHLSHALAHDLVYEPKNTLRKDRDARKYFLAKIGVVKPMVKESACDITSSISSATSWGSATSISSHSDYVSDMDFQQGEQNLLQLLLKCHNSNDPPTALLCACKHYRYPLLAILATTYEPDSFVTCWLTWLQVSCDIHIENIDTLTITGSLVTAFLSKVLENGFYKTLKQSLRIFLLDNPLRCFVDFLCSCQYSLVDKPVLQHDLEEFHSKMKLKRSNSYVNDVDHEMLYLNNKVWIENTSISLLATTLEQRTTPYSRVQLLQTLMDLELERYFFQTLPNLRKLHQIFTFVYEADITAAIDISRLFDVATYSPEMQKCVRSLLTDRKYDEALRIARMEDVLVDEVLMEKWAQPHMDFHRGEHWIQCDKEFRVYLITPCKAVIFYQNLQHENSTSAMLKYQLLSLAYQWASEYDLDSRNNIEKEVWETYLTLPSVVNVPIHIDAEICRSYGEISFDLNSMPNQPQSSLSQEDIHRLDSITTRLLNSENVHQALRLTKHFPNYSNNNLDILKLCYSLAEGLILPIHLTTKERLLIRKVKSTRSYSCRRKPLLSFRLSSSASRSPASSFGTSYLDAEPKVQDTLSLLECLSEGLGSGTQLGERIMMRYRISMNTNTSYNNILSMNMNSMDLLVNAMTSSSLNKLEIAHDVFSTYDWSKDMIADFLCEQLINTVTESVETHEECMQMWDVHLQDEIHLILQLLPDSCTLLGNKLYAYGSALHKAQTITNDLQDIAMGIELLILSHACFTADCNMEGISIILKKCQTIVNLLLALKHWPLIVRLLIGVGRYNELHYVFHILRENDQFEFLLRKGNAKDHALRVALIDYLRKFCPDNKELYEMVALYFSLYSEVAHIWEAKAQQAIRNLIAISKLEMINRKLNPDECIFVELTNTEATRICLQKTMENYSHAAEYHLQGEKLAQSMNAARQAEVIALQYAMVKERSANATTKCILSLSTSQISALLSSLSFHQAIIVTEAYQYQADWAAAIFDHFIVNNEQKYFDSYRMTFNLTDATVHNISRHFLVKNVTAAQGIKNMKAVLHALPSIHIKYRIISELGFTDMLEELLNNDQLNYLKDTVWKRGYRD